MEGTPKQLLRFGDYTMVGRVVATAERSSLDPIVVVTGYEADEVGASVAPERSRFVVNRAYEQGNMSSLRAGVAVLEAPDAVMVLLADQPEVTVEIIEIVGAAWTELRPFAAVARYRGAVGHPWVLSADAVAAASDSLEGTKALWPWLTEQHAGKLIEVELDLPKPIDVNTTGDYESALARLGLG